MEALTTSSTTSSSTPVSVTPPPAPRPAPPVEHQAPPAHHAAEVAPLPALPAAVQRHHLEPPVPKLISREEMRALLDLAI